MGSEWQFPTATGVATVGGDAVRIDRRPVGLLGYWFRLLVSGGWGARAKALGAALGVLLVCWNTWYYLMTHGIVPSSLEGILTMIGLAGAWGAGGYLWRAYNRGLRSMAIDLDAIDSVAVDRADQTLTIHVADAGRTRPFEAAIPWIDDGGENGLEIVLPHEDAVDVAIESFELRGIEVDTSPSAPAADGDATVPRTCSCGGEFELRQQGRSFAPLSRDEPREYRVYVCPECGKGTRFEGDRKQGDLSPLGTDGRLQNDHGATIGRSPGRGDDGRAVGGGGRREEASGSVDSATRGGKDG